MKRIILILSLFFLLLSCEAYVTDRSDLTLSGKYVVSKLHITSVDQNQTPDSLYLLGTTYTNNSMPHPFNVIPINNFYIHMDYSTIRLNLLGVTPYGQDIWEYGTSPNEIFYRVLNNNAYDLGYLQFDYITQNGTSRRITFHIEHDGFESLQLKSSGGWFNGELGEKQVMTIFLTRVGP
jgi:hypothetical protein